MRPPVNLGTVRQDTIWLYHLDFENDTHFIPDNHSTGLQRLVPGQPEILAVDRCCGACPSTDIPPRVLDLLAGPSTLSIPPW